VIHTVWKGPAEIEAHTSLTVTDPVALTDPDDAVIEAMPFATEVTRPVDETVATATADVARVGDGGIGGGQVDRRLIPILTAIWVPWWVL
jgi:hypothetical protein